MHLAVNYKDVEMIKFLLEQGADVNRKGVKGSTPLHFAVMAQNLEIVKLLKQHHADEIIKTKSKSAPLKIAKSLNENKYNSNTSKEILDILEGKSFSEEQTPSLFQTQKINKMGKRDPVMYKIGSILLSL